MWKQRSLGDQGRRCTQGHSRRSSRASRVSSILCLWCFLWRCCHRSALALLQPNQGRTRARLIKAVHVLGKSRPYTCSVNQGRTLARLIKAVHVLVNQGRTRLGESRPYTSSVNQGRTRARLIKAVHVLVNQGCTRARLIKAVHVLGEAAMQAVWDGVREPQLADRAGLDVVTWTCVCSVHACMPHMRTNAWHACTMHAPCMHYARTMHV